jgi:hypothetical protein
VSSSQSISCSRRCGSWSSQSEPIASTRSKSGSIRTCSSSELGPRMSTRSPPTLALGSTHMTRPRSASRASASTFTRAIPLSSGHLEGSGRRRRGVQRGLPVRPIAEGIDIRPSCRSPTGRCVGPTHSLGSLRDAKARSVNGPSRRCRREPGHLLLLVPPLRVRAQRTRIGTVPVQRMPMPVFPPHGRKDGTPHPEVVRADGRGQVS